MSRGTTSAEDRHRAELVREATAARAKVAAAKAAESRAIWRQVIDRINGKRATNAGDSGKHGWGKAVARINADRGQG